ncbi:MAG: aminotransferase class V-fold PLP-dependent enzyme [Clostridia bacterium]|nr:aminotransferase class V-fold PLP-dependent enzyme [Clostridia bacterium]
MIYFDNAATGGFKPRAVTDGAETVLRFLSANPGRSGHRLSLTGAKIVEDCRDIISQTFLCSPERVIFTKNCTEALNLAIFGAIKNGDHVITTVYEHNSVLRPLFRLKELGVISLDIVAPSVEKSITDRIKEKICDKTRVIVTTAVSNVTGEELPVESIGRLAKENGLIYIVDGAQGGGHIPLSVNDTGISLLALAGHKGLYGIMGSGALILADGMDIEPLIYGGTGSESFNVHQPESYPEKLEAGTLNLPAISALYHGVRYVKDNMINFSENLFSMTGNLINNLSTMKNVTCYSKPNRAGIVAFALNNLPSSEVADILNTDYDIAVRGGLHCAPLIHKFLNTHGEGLTRISLAVQNSSREINYLLKAVAELTCR